MRRFASRGSACSPQPRVRKSGLLRALAALWLTAVGLAGAVQAAEYPPGFFEEVAFSGLTQPVNIEFAADGRIFVAEKGGALKVFDSLTDSFADTVVNLGGNVHNAWDRGMLGLALDPDFPTRPYAYLLYTYDAGDSWGDTCPDPPGFTNDGCSVNGRISRLEISPSNSLVGDETVLVEGRWCQQYPSHSVGDLVFDALDRVLYASAGDGASFNFVDYGQGGGSPGSPTPENVCDDPPVPPGGSQSPPSAEGGALRSQDLRTVGDPVSYDGTIIAIDPDTGAPAAGNPLLGGDPGDDAIVAYGLRNPFRLGVRQGSHEIFIAEVGWSTWEEINYVADGRDGIVENFGWPCYEGSPRQSGYDAQNLDLCESLYAEGSAVPGINGGHTLPFLEYRHGVHVDPDPAPFRCSKNGSSAPGGVVLYENATAYPSAYQDALFFADYSRDCLFVIYPDGNGQLDPTSADCFADAATNPVDLEIGPDGVLYYVDINGGRVIRVDYASDNTPPVAVASASPNSGPAPLFTTLDASDSYDPDGDELTFAWDLDGDGAFDDAIGATTSGTIPVAGQWDFRVRVSDSAGEFSDASVLVTSGNAAPTAEILTPAPGLTWKVGDSLTVSGRGIDVEDGNLAASRLSWEVILHHCPDLECHTHPVGTFVGVDEISFLAPDHEWYAYLEIVLTVTDTGFGGAGGGGVLSDTTRLELFPQTVDVTYETVPSGLDLTVGGQRYTAPVTLTTIVGSLNTVAAISPQVDLAGGWVFDQWSDGGAVSHEFIGPPSPLTLTATFAPRPATVFDYPDFGSIAGLQLNSAAVQSGNALRLNPDQNFRGGSVYAVDAVELNANSAFSTAFTFRIHGNDVDGADGMAFVVQSQGLTAIGGTGGALSYGGVAPSLAVEFDTEDSGEGDPNGNHVGVNVNGNMTSIATIDPGFNLEDGQPHGAWIDYSAQTGLLEISVAEDPTARPPTPQLVVPIDLAGLVGNAAWFGFSGASGALKKIHDLESWRWIGLEDCATIDATCDGIDDDCDGAVDEDFPTSPEVCDGLDNDCNGAIDEGGVCGCSGDAECDDGLFCNGVERCDLSSGACLSGDDPCLGASCDELADQCSAPAGPDPKIEVGVIGVGAQPKLVTLRQAYLDPVVVATVDYRNNSQPVVTRVSNVAADGFRIRLQNPSGDPVVEESVHYVVVEAGSWVIDGVTVEAWSYLSRLTDRAGAWIGEAQSYTASFTNPVVLGQVMTENDARWSTFWNRGFNRINPPSGTMLYTGKHVGEDPATERNDERIGVIVFEAGHGTLGGIEFEAGLTADIVLGVDNSIPTLVPWSAPFAETPQVRVASMAAMDGANGGWAQLEGEASTSSLSLSIDEDQVLDAERVHSAEQVGYAAFGRPFAVTQATDCLSDGECDDGAFCNGSERCESGSCVAGVIACGGATCDESSDSCPADAARARLETIEALVDATPLRVSLQLTYDQPVLACSVQYFNNDTPVVPRIGDLDGSGFELWLQSPSGATVAADTVRCLVAEEGLWNVDGVTIEARRIDGVTTDHDGSWVGQPVATTHDFRAPVVLGQVQSANDSRWSVFWSRGAGVDTPPAAGAIFAGKTVCEDPEIDRLSEVLGVIVIEAGHGSLAGVEYEAAVGSDAIRGVGNNPPYGYLFQTPFPGTPAFATVTQAGMDGSNGGWAQLHGAPALTQQGFALSIDEDTLSDPERSHFTEQVGYFVLAAPLVYEQP